MDSRILGFLLLLSTAYWERLAGTTVSTACPIGCHCSLISITCCGSEQFLQLPITGTYNTTKLSLTRCLGLAISRAMFQNLKSLEELKVKSTPVTYIDANTFVDFSKLKRLFLNGLNLTMNNIHPAAFNDLPIEELDLNNNSLMLVHSQMFIGLKNLRTLDLSRNKISVIHNQAFEGLQHITMLNLDYNNLRSVSPYWFKPFSNYSSLHISVEGNNITKECIFRGMELAENKWFIQSITPHNILTLPNTTVHPCSIPMFSNHYQEIYVKESASVVLPCSASSIPKPTFTWLLPIGLEVMPLNPIFTINNRALHISRVKAGDSGLYACLATNIEGTNVALTRLTVITNFNTAIPGSPMAPTKKASLVLLIIFIVILSLIVSFILGYILKMIYKLAKKNTNTNIEFSRFVDTPNILQVPENPQPMPHL
ncbi:leucine-rich repeat and fibronectin type III domain-containing protein 1-like protein [Pelodytes ibericus]